MDNMQQQLVLAEKKAKELFKAIEKAGYKPGIQVSIAMDAANSELWNDKEKKYHIHTHAVAG